jgi:hypothetical protein
MSNGSWLLAIGYWLWAAPAKKLLLAQPIDAAAGDARIAGSA